ncbi:MAG TPA: class A beta-lactamase-related serine hydrolase [Dehalococcoidia bacterium]|jgi:CubicO group peptidase (beta-lactamase class C family)|nr:class A beta-lactamase-related serine hydrolase [Dehalococcoidia bacterium]
MGTGLSTDRLQRIDRHLTENYIDAGRIYGALTLVARRGEVAHFSALGLMDAERNKPTELDTIYRIYSMTKPITAVAMMLLYEEGKFQLSDPLSDYLPEWADTEIWVSGEYPNFKTRPLDRPITIRDLLSHQAGLTLGFFDNAVDRAYPPMLREQQHHLGHYGETDLEGMFAQVAKVPLRYAPGTAWQYSVALELCGYLIQVITGKRFDVFLKERLFAPLGMTDTAFNVPDEKLDRFSANYAPADAGGIEMVDDPVTSKFRETPTLFSGGGGLVGTALDYYRLCQMLLNGGELDGERILGRKTIELMTTNHLPNGESITDRALPGMFNTIKHQSVGYGLGMSIGLAPAVSQIVGSAGQYAWGGAAATTFWVDPVEELAVVFMTQLKQSPYSIPRELQVLVNAAIVD